MRLKLKLLILLLSVLVFSCRGTTTKKPPIHPLQNMDNVGRLDPQSQNFASYKVGQEPFEDLNNDGVWNSGEPFEDLNENNQWDKEYVKYINDKKMSMIEPVDGTIYRTESLYSLNQSQVDSIDIGKTGMRNGSFIKSIPSQFVQEGFLDRGEERYNIYCSACHGITGDGLGMVLNKNYSWNKNVKPANLQDLSDKDESCKDGYLFDVITNGKGQMSGYPYISVSDRWAIVAYVRALSVAKGVDIECCNIDDLSDIKYRLKKMTSMDDKLLSDEFECLVELGQVQKAMKKEMVELQQTVNCDAYDGQWGGGTLKKWKKWKKEFSR